MKAMKAIKDFNTFSIFAVAQVLVQRSILAVFMMLGSSSLFAQSIVNINIGDVVNGSLAISTQVDDYHFSANSGDTLFFDAQQGSAINFTWQLTAPSGSVIFATSNFQDKDIITLTENGQHTLTIAGQRNASGDYQFQILNVPAVSSNAIAIGQIVQGEIAIQGEVDEFTFSVAQTQSYYIDVGLASVLRLNWTLLDAANNVIASDGLWRDRGPIELSTGNYTFRVDGNGDDLSPYQLQIIAVPATTIIDIALGDIITGSISTPGEIVQYRLNISETTLLFFDAQIGASNAIDWYLRDTNGSAIFSDTFWSDQENISLNPGSYILEIDGRDDRTVSYQFQVVAVPEASNTAISLDEQVQGQFLIQGEVDNFDFSVTEAREIFFDAQVGSANDIAWKLIDDQGNEIFNDPSWRDVEPIVLPIGDYTLTVDGRGDSVVDYQFQLFVVPETTTVPVDFYFGETGFISVPGQRQRYTVEVTEAMDLSIERLNGGGGNGFSWSVFDQNQVVLTGSNTFGNLAGNETATITQAGTYTIEFDGNGDKTGVYNFRVWPVQQPAVQNIALDEMVSGRLTAKGQVREYQFTATEGLPLFLNLHYLGQPRPTYSLFSPSGSRLINARTTDASVNTLPETGIYTLQVNSAAGVNTALNASYSFQLSSVNDNLVIPDAAELVVTSATANFDRLARSGEFEITWTVTNNGAVPTNVGNWTDRIVFRTDTEFSQIEGSVSTPFDFDVRADVSHSGILMPGESYTASTTINYQRDDALSTTFEILIDADIENRVFEASPDLNQYTISPAVYLVDQRATTGQGAITSDVPNGSLLPANVPIALSGNANLSGGAVNLYFVIDSSGSTTNPSGFDANGDGVVDARDDFNGDGRNGDVLDVELGASISVIEQFKQRSSDVLVSAIHFGGEAFAIDLGAKEFRQTFQSPNVSSSGENSDIEQALRNHFARTPGTAFGPPITKILEIAQNAPASDQNFMFFLTDGQAFQNATPEQLDALGNIGFSFFAFQIGSSQLSTALQDIVDGIDANPNSSALGQAVENPGDLPNIVLGSVSLDRVEVNGQSADALDVAGNFFKTVTLSEGENQFTITAFDSEQNTTERVITLFGAGTNGNNSGSQVASQGTLTFSGTFFNRATNRLYADAVLQNNSAISINNRVDVNLTIDPNAVTLDTADRVNAAGQAVIVFDDELGNGLSLNEQSQAIESIFSNPRRDRFAVAPSLLTSLNSEPYFTSAPIVFVDAGNSYSYNATALDDDNDDLSFSLALAPIGMSIDSASGAINWTPAANQGGTHQVVVSASDGNGGQAQQRFQVSVTTGLANLAPYITSSPVVSMLSAQGYGYQVLAVDPESSSIRYSLLSAPAGLTIDSATGIISASANAVAPGSYTVSLIAEDSAGGQAQQSYTLDVKGANQSPQIVSTAPTGASVLALYTYAVQVQDDDPQLSFELLEAPMGMSINALTGVISMTAQPSQIGQHAVRLKVTDPYQASAEQSYVLTVSEDAQNPSVSIVLNASEIVLGNTLQVTVNASDNIGLASVELTFDGVTQTLDNTGIALITPSAGGIFTLVATAVDTAGLVSQETVTVRVVDTSDATPPRVEIVGPAAGTLVSAMIDIIGTVEADDLFEYRLEYTNSNEFDAALIANDGPQWRTFASGNSQASAAVLGSFDATTVRNDSYAIRLLAEDINGNRAAAVTFLEVNGASKPGEFRLEYTDLSLPVSNIPIEIKRVYQSTHANIDGELGYGWRLQLSDADIRESVPVAPMEETLGLFVNNPYTAKTRVYLNAPDGRRIGFTFDPEPTQSLIGSAFIPKFTPDPGVFYELEVDPVSISQSSDGSFVIFFVPFNYNPQDFRLIEPNGTTWHYNQFDGLDKVVDRVGNELVYTDEGIFHSSGLAVTFERDALGRITTITDPQGEQLAYSYNSQGELVSFSDRNGDVERYGYVDNPQHFISQITDPKGKVSLIEFDDEGRLAGTTDALGNKISQNWDTDTFTGTITDAKGNVTALTYDLRGNVLSETDPLGGITRYSFDENDNVISTSDANGNTTTFTYDEFGNVLSETDALGNITRYAYDEFSNTSMVTNALGNTSVTVYDSEGNLQRMQMPDGSTIEYVYDDQGRIVSMTDGEGNQTRYEYSGSFITPTTIVLPDGNTRLRELDGNGLIVSITDEAGNVTSITRDAKGRMLEQIDPANQRISYGYENNRLVSMTDASGRTKFFDYDDKNQHIATRYDNNTQVQLSYDENGNKVSVTDTAGNITAYAFDALNRMVSRTDANGETETYTYDAVGNVLSKTDRRGYLINYQYDALNRMLSETWLDTNGDLVWQLNKTYDAIGNVLSMDDGSSVISNTYDANNRVSAHSVAIASGPSSSLRFTYDGNEKLIAVTDGATTKQMTYNNRQFVEQLALTTGVLSLSAEISYDPRGLRASMLRKQNQTPIGNSNYVYDARALSQSIEHEVSGFNYDFAYVWDDIRRVTSQVQAGENIDYVYDNLDQLSEANRSQLPNESFSFDENGNLANGAVITAANRLVSNADIEYRYDEAGNMVSRSNIQSGQRSEFTYDHRNRLVSILVLDANDAVISDISYGYDAMDRRIKRSVNNNQEFTHYVFDDAWADVQSDGSVNKRYMNGVKTDEKVARISNGQAAWYLTDKQQTVHSIVDSNGLAINELKYDSFGQLLSETNPGDGDRFTYTGRELERLTGIYDYRARSYDPVAKRFLSEDPIEFEANDANLYRYVFNNPLNATDPSGENALMEYGALICKIAVPQIGQWKMIGSCLNDLYTGIAKSIESATANDGLAQNFTQCVTVGTATNMGVNAVGAGNGLAGAALGAYVAMSPPQGPGSGSGGGGGGGGGSGSPGDAIVSVACGAF